MLENGFIMLPRSNTNWQWYDEPNTMRIFLHLLLTANYTDRSWHGVPVLRGQRICTYGVLAGELGMSIQQVRTALSHLECSGEVSRQTLARASLITVNNYDSLLAGVEKVDVPLPFPWMVHNQSTAF